MKTATKAKLAKRYKVTYSTVYGWARENTFPQPTVAKDVNSLWSIPEVDNWLSIHRPRTLDRVKATKSVAPNPTKQEKPIMPAGKSMLDVITFLLENDREKQKLVLDLLLD